jgi:hypothetical protein
MRAMIFAAPFYSMLASRLLKNDGAHGLTVSPPNRDKLTMRATH